MTNLTVNLKTRVEAELAEALERQATTENRTVSQLVRILLREAMIAAGQIEQAARHG